MRTTAGRDVAREAWLEAERPLLEQWGKSPEEKQASLDTLVTTLDFLEFHWLVEEDIGHWTPHLELIPGDGDCLFTAILRYLKLCHHDPLSTDLLWKTVGNLIASKDEKTSKDGGSFMILKLRPAQSRITPEPSRSRKDSLGRTRTKPSTQMARF